MYNTVKACVRYNNKCSQLFDINAGVKQGDPLSAAFFIFFINDIIESTSNENGDAMSINDFNLFMLLYADDAVLFSKSSEALQNMLHAYSTLWDLKVNTEKNENHDIRKGS